MAKGGQKKQSISGQRQQREKEAGEAETGAGDFSTAASQIFPQKERAEQPCIAGFGRCFPPMTAKLIMPIFFLVLTRVF